MLRPFLKIKICVIFVLLIFVRISFAQAQLKNINPDRPNDIRVRALSSMVNHNLEGKGFKTSATSKLGSGFEFVYRRITADGAYRFVGSTSLTEFDTAPGLSPRKIESSFDRKFFDYRFNSGFGLGAEFRERKADGTTPNEVITETAKTGLRTFYSRSNVLGENLKFEFEAGLFIPLSQYEKTPRTGHLTSFVAPDLEMNFVYKVNNFIDASIGVQVLYETANYAGSGDRGTQAATETFISTQIPVDLRFSF